MPQSPWADTVWSLSDKITRSKKLRFDDRPPGEISTMQAVVNSIFETFDFHIDRALMSSQTSSVFSAIGQRSSKRCQRSAVSVVPVSRKSPTDCPPSPPHDPSSVSEADDNVRAFRNAVDHLKNPKHWSRAPNVQRFLPKAWEYASSGKIDAGAIRDKARLV